MFHAANQAVPGTRPNIDGYRPIATERDNAPQRPPPFQNTGIETMGLFTKDIKTMDDLFVHQLQDI